jgi:CheY-like chemotaxis protein
MTKVLVATGFNGTWTREAVRELGIHDLLTKPLSLQTLAEVIQDALSASR